MPLITITKGGPDQEIPDGVYSVTLTSIKGPKTVTAQRGKNAGKDIDLFDWEFAIDEGPYMNAVIEASTSTASGPRSKLYSFLTALFGGKSPQAGAGFEVGDLAGRQALATIRTDENGWPRIENLGAKPTAYQAPAAAPVAAPVATQPVPATPVPTPAAAAPQTAREAVTSGQPNPDNLPF